MFRVLPFAGSLILAMLLGYLLGRIATVQFAVSDVPPLTLRKEGRPGVAVVHIDGINDGRLEGAVKGNVRFFLGEDQILTGSDGTFAVEPWLLLTNDISVLVPDGAEFVASKRGEKYYPVFSSQGERLLPENRVYFKSAADAEAAGFHR